MDNRRQFRVFAFIAGLSALAIGALVAWYFQQNPGSGNQRWVMIGVVAFLLIDVAVLAIFFGVRAAKERRLAWQEQADTLGDAIDLDFDHEPPKKFQHDFLYLPELKKSGTTNHLARGTIADRPALVFESSYVVSTGQTTYSVYHTVYATDAPDWPPLSVTPRHAVSKLLRKLGRRSGLLLDDPRFNHAFVVDCDDEPFAVTLLTPEMQRFMIEKPKARWRLTHGKVFLIYSGSLKLDRMPVSVDRLARFWSHVPPEVEAWGS